MPNLSEQVLGDQLTNKKEIMPFQAIANLLNKSRYDLKVNLRFDSFTKKIRFLEN